MATEAQPTPNDSKNLPKSQAALKSKPEANDEVHSAKETPAWDPNEVYGAAADLPFTILEKPVLNSGDIININKKKYKVTNPITLDYGSVELIEEGKETPEVLMHYEVNDCKCKRIQIECDLLSSASKTRRTHILRLLDSGQIKSANLRYFVTDLYGPSLAEIRGRLPDEKFSIPTCLKLAYVTMECLEELHKTGYIHRDVKPSVFNISITGDLKRIFLTHFGLSRRYRATDKTMMQKRAIVPAMGSLKYASRNVHKCVERGRKDDIESWVYMVAEFFERNIILWAAIKNSEEVLKVKEAFMSEGGFRFVLHVCNGLPQGMATVVRLLNALSFDSVPDYHLFRSIFRNAIIRGNYREEPFDWLKMAVAKPSTTDILLTAPVITDSKTTVISAVDPKYTKGTCEVDGEDDTPSEVSVGVLMRDPETEDVKKEEEKMISTKFYALKGAERKESTTSFINLSTKKSDEVKKKETAEQREVARNVKKIKETVPKEQEKKEPGSETVKFSASKSVEKNEGFAGKSKIPVEKTSSTSLSEEKKEEKDEKKSAATGSLRVEMPSMKEASAKSDIDFSEARKSELSSKLKGELSRKAANSDVTAKSEDTHGKAKKEPALKLEKEIPEKTKEQLKKSKREIHRKSRERLKKSKRELPGKSEKELFGKSSKSGKGKQKLRRNSELSDKRSGKSGKSSRQKSRKGKKKPTLSKVDMDLKAKSAREKKKASLSLVRTLSCPKENVTGEWRGPKGRETQSVPIQGKNTDQRPVSCKEIRTNW